MGNFVALSYETLTLAQQGAAAGAQPAKKEEKPAAEEAPVKVPSTKELGELQNDCASLRAAAEVCQANAKKALDKAEEEKEQTQKKDEEAHKKEEKKAEEDRQKKKKDEILKYGHKMFKYLYYVVVIQKIIPFNVFLRVISFHIAYYLNS